MMMSQPQGPDLWPRLCVGSPNAQGLVGRDSCHVGRVAAPAGHDIRAPAASAGVCTASGETAAC